MLPIVAQALAALALLYFGGEWLVRGASTLASRLGVSALAIGLTVVAFGTSAPELVVSLGAALAGANDISVGNVVGSNIANFALILGLAALIRPAVIEAKLVRIDAPILIAASVAMVAVLADGTASRVEGALLLSALIAYTGFTFWESRRESEPVQEEIAAASPARGAKSSSGAGLVLAGLAMLVLGGQMMVDSAVALASALGLSQAAIGLTVVAVGTSLPEFATTVIAARRGQGDIAVGNVVGSNLFNILGILGLTAIVRPLARGAIGWPDLGAMLGLACFVTVCISTRPRLGRVAGGLLLGFFALYTGWRLSS